MENIVLEDADVFADSPSGNESLDEVVRAPLRRARPPAVLAPLAIADFTLATFVQYVEDFKFWVNNAGRPRRILSSFTYLYLVL